MQKNDKLLKLLRVLKFAYCLEQPNIEKQEKLFNTEIKQRVLRVEVRRMIGGELEIVDRHTITGWLNQLINIGALTPNPSSEYVNRGLYKTAKFMPNSDTKYFIEIETINSMIQKLHTPHTTTLDSYSEDSTASPKVVLAPN